MQYSICSYALHRTFDAGKMDIFSYIRWCQEAGFTQLDPWMHHLKQGYADNAFLAQVKAAAAEAGLPFGCLAVDGGHMYDVTDEKMAANRATRYRWLEIAAALGFTQMRVDAGGSDQQSAEEIMPVVVAGYEEIIARAQPLGVEIIIENHWGPFKHPDNLYKLLDRVPGLGLLFDSYNWPAGTHAKAWPQYARYARLTHFKSFNFDDDGNETVWDIPGCIRLLQAAGYNGAWGIESTPDDGDEIGGALKTLALLKRTLE
jgi:sugar phosphate isomerase/epimerase